MKQIDTLQNVSKMRPIDRKTTRFIRFIFIYLLVLVVGWLNALGPRSRAEGVEHVISAEVSTDYLAKTLK